MTLLSRFASLDSGEGGVITTKPLLFEGDKLILNAVGGSGIRVELLDEDYNVISGYAKEDCTVIATDSVRHEVSWTNGDLSSLAGTPVRLRLYSDGGQIYSFGFKSGLQTPVEKAWIPGEAVAAGDVRTYAEQKYECVQPHVTQAGWTPDITPALWRELRDPDVIEPWTQPTGAHDAYRLGDWVLFRGEIYECILDYNVWSPEAYPAGWERLS